MDVIPEDDPNLSTVSASESSFITDLEGGKVTLTFKNDLENYDACRSILEIVEPGLPICALEDGGDCCTDEPKEDSGSGFLQIPSLAIVVFLQEDNNKKFEKANERFQLKPWIFHHSETVNRTTTQCVASNNLDYYRAGETGPLCGIRQMPCGKQIVRIVRFINNAEWQDNVDLYGLILGQQPEVIKPDFVLFTTGQTVSYNIQFAIKRAPKGITCTSVDNVTLNFRINHPGHIVPLLPFVCDNVSSRHWQSQDFDGNTVRFEAQERAQTPDISELVLLEPVESDSALSDSTVNAYPSNDIKVPPKIKPKPKPKPKCLTLDRGKVEGRESNYKFDEYGSEYGTEYSTDPADDNLLSPVLSPVSPDPSQLESPWSPVSQTDSGQFSQESRNYDSTVLSGVSSENDRRQEQLGSESHCSSDLGFYQDRFSSSCASESRLDDQLGHQLEGRSTEQAVDRFSNQYREQNRFADQQRDNRNSQHRQDEYHSDPISYQRAHSHSSNNGYTPDYYDFHRSTSYSDHGLGGSDGYASTYDESESGYAVNYNHQSHQRLHDNYSHELKPNRHGASGARELHHPDYHNAAGKEPNFNLRNSHQNSNHNPRVLPVKNGYPEQLKSWNRKMSSSESHLDTPQKYAFQKLKKYRESQSREALDLFNVSHLNQRQKERPRSHRKHKSRLIDDIKSVSELESIPGSDTEYEQAYESIERDLEIINKALYGNSSQKNHVNGLTVNSTGTKDCHKDGTKNSHKDSHKDSYKSSHKSSHKDSHKPSHRDICRESETYVEAQNDQALHQRQLPYVQGFYV